MRRAIGSLRCASINHCPCRALPASRANSRAVVDRCAPLGFSPLSSPLPGSATAFAIAMRVESGPLRRRILPATNLPGKPNFASPARWRMILPFVPLSQAFRSLRRQTPSSETRTDLSSSRGAGNVPSSFPYLAQRFRLLPRRGPLPHRLTSLSGFEPLLQRLQRSAFPLPLFHLQRTMRSVDLWKQVENLDNSVDITTVGAKR